MTLYGLKNNCIKIGTRRYVRFNKFYMLLGEIFKTKILFKVFNLMLKKIGSKMAISKLDFSSYHNFVTILKVYF